MESDFEIKKILENAKTIAVVGCSKTAGKPAHDVPAVLQSKGYKIIPINPTAEEILGEKCYPSLLDLPFKLKKEIDIVDIFRPSEELGNIVAQVVKLKEETGKTYTIWAQLGISDEMAAGVAKAEGLEIIQDRCIKTEYNRLFP